MLDRVASLANASTWHHPVYRRGFAWLRSLPPGVPSLATLNEWLAEIGWAAVYVDGYIPVTQYRTMLSERTFPLSRRLRRWRSLEHSAEPDFIHDVLGHLPMMFDEGYRALVQDWALRGRNIQPTTADRDSERCLRALISACDSGEAEASVLRRVAAELQDANARATAERSPFFQLETFYTWTFEFGIVHPEGDSPVLIGAAALSSPGEMVRIFSGETVISPFANGAVGRAVDYTTYQREVFRVGSFQAYLSALRDI